MAQRLMSTISEFVILVVVAFILALGIRAAVAEVRLVPTASMEPTIAAGDRLFTVKVLYYFTEPKRGDIIVFNVPPEAYQIPNSPPFIKRVIGVPGDTVVVRDGKVFINGKVYNVEAASVPNYAYGPIKVEKGTLFVLGDNRNESFDSHEWGLLPRKNVIAKAVFAIWPFDHIKVLK